MTNRTNLTNLTGLDTYPANKAGAMAAAARGLESGDAARETIAAECSVSDLTGVRRVRIRDFQLVSDSGPAFGGFGLGPSSPELLLGVLASCLTHTYLIGAAQRGMSLDGVHVRFEAENNTQPFSASTPPILPILSISARSSGSRAGQASRRSSRCTRMRRAPAR